MPEVTKLKQQKTSKPATIHDVARLSGVSIATVSRYFSGKASALAPETLSNVRKAVETLGYMPSEIGRSLRLARSQVVVMMVPDSTNHFTADVSASLENSLNQMGLSMVLANTSENAGKQDRLLADAQGLRARAIVLQGGIDTPLLREMAARQSNLIFVNRRPAPGIVAPYVGIDNFAAGLAVGQHFIRQGYRNLVAIHGPRHYQGSSARLDGFIAGIGNHDSILQLESEFTMDSGYQHGMRLLADTSRRFAVFCANDMIAYGVHRAATERGLRIPEDVILFGFDDNRLNEWLAPWLSTVRVPALDFGPAIAELIAGPDEETKRSTETILPFSLKIRSSG